MSNFILPDVNLRLQGYSFLIEKYCLKVPIPDFLSAVSLKQRQKRSRFGEWQIFSKEYALRDDSLAAHLEFALKFEGINLAVLNNLFKIIDKCELELMVKSEPNGKYARRIWFLYEWLSDDLLDVPDIKNRSYIDLLDGKLQYASSVSKPSERHRIRNNLPGNKNFCPLIRRTEKLENLIQKDIACTLHENIGNTHPDLLMRTASFLLLGDSKASYSIEGETPPRSRTERWARVIGQAGKRDLTSEELERLQRELIGDDRFIHLGYRKEGGFIGTHGRLSQTPIPEHISAKAEDLDVLMNGLLETVSSFKEVMKRTDSEKGVPYNYHPVLAAASIAFGFVFIHPFEDGNGRIHRYLMHHILSESGFAPAGIVFPVSIVILRRIDKYKKILEAHSKPRLPLIEWRVTERYNVEVLNETIDFYRYFEATHQAEFLCECILETICDVLPKEVDYLRKHDLMKSFINNYVEMPDQKIGLLINFLNQNNGKLSNRAKNKEFAKLTEREVQDIETKYEEIFLKL